MIKTKDKIKLKPLSAVISKDLKLKGIKAWWYEDAKHIDVLISTETGTYSCRISRRRLADWIKRTE